MTTPQPLAARSALEAMIRTDNSMTVWSPGEVAAALDAYRDQVRADALAAAKVEAVAWLVKKASEYRSTGGRQHAMQAEAIATLASKLDRGAVRAFLGTAHYRDAMDAYRAEVLREAANVVDTTESPRCGCGPCLARRDKADELRRMADEAEVTR